MFTLHQTAFQPSKVVRPLCGSGSRNFKNSYRCPIYNNSHPYRCQLFRYWTRVALYLRRRLTSTLYYLAHRSAFSVFCVRDIHSYPQARYFTHGLSVCLHQQSLQLLLVFYLLLTTEEIRTPSIITFANDMTLSVVTVLLSEPTQPLFTTPMARRILQFACYKEPSVLLDSSHALSLKRILGQYTHWYYCC